MEREHVAVVVLLLVLVVALVPLALGQTRDDSIDQPSGNRNGTSAGRLVRLDELEGGCLSDDSPARFVGGCQVRIAPTEVAVWDPPVIGRFMPRELRRIDVALPAGACEAEVLLRAGEIEIDAELDQDDHPTASMSLAPEGGTIDVSLGPGLDCELFLTDLSQ